MKKDIQKEEILEYIREQDYKPLIAEQLLHAFECESVADIKVFMKNLRELEEDGQVFLTKKQRYELPERINIISGRLQGNNKGYAFVLPDIDGIKDVFISEDKLKGAMHNDRVMARILQKSDLTGRGPAGEIIRILKHANKKVVAVFNINNHYASAFPLDKRVCKEIILKNPLPRQIQNGDLIVCEIIRWPDRTHKPEGRISEVLGSVDNPGSDVLSVVKKHSLADRFSHTVLIESETVSENIDKQELEQRLDLRGQTIITIDGDDSKDFDDAVGLRQLPDGNLELGVHIADVSYYVSEGSALDNEARKRGCSVYLPDRVLPMLPFRLSDNICSLIPHKDRLTLSCIMEIDQAGTVVNYEIKPSVICSSARLTYSLVNRFLLSEKSMELSADKKIEFLLPMLQQMQQLCLLLRENRFARGAIDFHIPEAQIVLNDKGHPVEIKVREHNIAEQIIEEFMILANETVAQHFYWLEIPFLYRVHQLPAVEKVEKLNHLLWNFGLGIKNCSELHPSEFNKILNAVAGTSDEKIISTVMLRTMKQAHYSAVNEGHFGLASDCYTHFTSPIRRYPDLMIHRIINDYLRKHRLSAKRLNELNEMLPQIAQASSDRERAAMEAEMEADEMKKAEYMSDRLGEIYEGFISSVVSFGFFVQLANTIEGLVRIDSLNDDYYWYNEDDYCLQGTRSGKIYRLGQNVVVTVVKVNIPACQIDFELAQSTSGSLSIKEGEKHGRKNHRRK